MLANLWTFHKFSITVNDLKFRDRSQQCDKTYKFLVALLHHCFIGRYCRTPFRIPSIWGCILLFGSSNSTFEIPAFQLLFVRKKYMLQPGPTFDPINCDPLDWCHHYQKFSLIRCYPMSLEYSRKPFTGFTSLVFLSSNFDLHQRLPYSKIRFPKLVKNYSSYREQ